MINDSNKLLIDIISEVWWPGYRGEEDHQEGDSGSSAIKRVATRWCKYIKIRVEWDNSDTRVINIRKVKQIKNVV